MEYERRQEFPSMPLPRRGNIHRNMRPWLLEAQRHRCRICGGPLSMLDSHIDHIVPHHAGGTDDWTNLQLVHMSCNLAKGGRRRNDDLERAPWA